ncbi:hypothetical protein BFL38_02140 [Brachyspira hampsonii]|uniref:DUF2147 domain-containing protein n=1 Tax=Brachyspira hampsonii TaxID=1287055 RepID=A0A1E5NBV2_9SPIR|nr:DUF2147 domain-containing protein [Brachyspira hampsonii]OEJ13571.1 hypothetical protein BFL38_02140 [Brachyspira hampsonii]
MKNKIITILIFTFVFNVLAFSQNADDITGLWYSQADSQNRISVVEIYKENNKYYAYSFAYKNSNDIVNDVNNPKKELRNLPLKGLVYLYDLEFVKGEWKNGKIYNPDDGKTYHAKVTLSDNGTEIKIRASADGAGIFGKNIVWQKLPSSDAAKYKPLNKSELRKLN